MKLKRIISGGQTGADEAGLKAAKDSGLETGGTAPKGWRIENYNGTEGSNPKLAEYGLVEHASRDYPPRTKQNVADSDGTVWFGFEGSPGAKLTFSTVNRLRKRLIINPAADELADWLAAYEIEVLNVAGNRLSEFNPTIYEDTYKLLTEAFRIYNAIYAVLEHDPTF